MGFSSFIQVIFTLFILNKRLLYGCPDYRKEVLGLLQCLMHAVLLCKFLDILLSDKHFSTSIFLLIAGDIESNPGTTSHALLKFCHWNLNSICARGSVKIPLIEAYNSLHCNVFLETLVLISDKPEPTRSRVCFFRASRSRVCLVVVVVVGLVF